MDNGQTPGGNTTTAATQSLLPVTQADRDLVFELMRSACTTELERRALRYIKDGRGDDSDAVQMVARHRQSHSLPGDVGTTETLDELANKPVGGDFSLRAFNVVRCLANAEFRSELDRCKDEAKYLMASLKEPGLPKYLRIGFPELEALHYLSTTPSAVSGDAGEVETTVAAIIAHLRTRADGFRAAAKKQGKRVGPLAKGFDWAALEIESTFAALPSRKGAE